MKLDMGLENMKEIIEFWKIVFSRNRKLAQKYFSPSARINIEPQNKTYFPEKYLDNFFKKSDFKLGKIVRIEFSETLVVTVCKFDPFDDAEPYYLTSFFVLDNSKIISLEQYYSPSII